MKKTLRTILSLLLVVVLCAAVIEPTILHKSIATAQTTQETKANIQWKEEAIADGVDVRSFEDTLYYAESAEENIIQLTEGMAYVNNEVVVFFKDGTTVEQKHNLLDSIHGKVIGCASVINEYQIQIEETTFAKLQMLCAKLNLNKNVKFASCNIATQRKDDLVLNDPWTDRNGNKTSSSWDESYVYGGNWALTATQTPSAWDYSEYFNHIRIGILDSGFEVNHEDLQGKISFPNKFHEKNNYPSSHGTHVAGIISANGDNGIGVAGICQNADLVCVDWQPEKSIGQKWSTNVRIFTGFISLVLSGAKVINMSLGSAGAYKSDNDFWWKVGMYFEGGIFSYMMASLLSKGYDFIAVQSAGNGDKNGDPCDSINNGSFAAVFDKTVFTGIHFKQRKEILDHIIIVGSSTYSHKGKDFYMSSFSNYGKNVSIYAPGSWVFSTDLTLDSEGNPMGYSYKSGTSMAAPVVTAITAMTWSVNPKLKGSEVKKIVCDPDNTIYNCVNYYNSENYYDCENPIDMPTARMINAKLSVEAAIRTLDLPEETTTEEESTTDEFTTDVEIETTESITVEANGENTPVQGNSDNEIIRRFAHEIGE